MKEQKTNAMRFLDKLKINYEVIIDNPNAEFHDGLESATSLGVSPDIVFKTIVTESPNHNYYVFCLPVNQVLNLKKCAKIVNEKSLSLLELKNLLQVTGYVRGGCTPIALKKNYPVVIEERALLYDKIYLSAGKIGEKLIINPRDLIMAINAKTGDLV